MVNYEERTDENYLAGSLYYQIEWKNKCDHAYICSIFVFCLLNHIPSKHLHDYTHTADTFFIIIIP